MRPSASRLARRYAHRRSRGLMASCAALAETAPSTLPSVQVQEQRRVTGDYAGGQVVWRRVGLLGDKDFMDTPFNTVSYTESFIRDRQAKDLTDVIAATDPTVFSNGVTGSWARTTRSRLRLQHQRHHLQRPQRHGALLPHLAGNVRAHRSAEGPLRAAQ